MKESDDCQYANLLWNRLTSIDQEMMISIPYHYKSTWTIFDDMYKSRIR